MSVCTQSIFRNLCRINTRTFSTAAKVKDVHEEPFEIFRTSESNPVNHNESHLNRFYTIPPKIKDIIFEHGGLPNDFEKQIKAFTECSILVRNPAIEIISYLNKADYTRPVNKFILYGKTGTGKSVTLAHILHYAFMKQMVLVHVPWPNIWFRFPKEVAQSSLNPDYIDLPIDAGSWLIHFKQQNYSLLSNLDLKLSKSYEWTQRETSNSGSPLLELVEFGINRMKFACGVINALMHELKAASTAGRCKTLVAVDGYNAFTSEHSGIFVENRVQVPPQKVSLTTAFQEITNYDWCNGAIVLTVDTRANKERRDSELPRYLLGKEGFEHLDPFLPVQVEKYTKDEFETVMEYYRNRKWVRNISAEGQQEIYILSNANPLNVITICNPL